ncbi:uncharacterized protein [Salminus brasiliensis]|uniref:uncharacterized protein isoform X7 n=1 Tax=Salminus brasiliensis TaxID=930266 RepID=UPI003B83619D
MPVSESAEVMFSILLLSGFCLLPSCLPRQYHFVKEARGWAEAQSFCRRTYADLAVVDSMEDVGRLLESANGTYNGSAWIGLYDDPDSSWRWSLDDPRFFDPGEKDFRNWVMTQPGVFRREPVCVLSDVGIWHLYPCETPLPFVCFDGRENATKSLVLISESKNWTEAQRYCREHHTDLASIRNRKENCRIADIVASTFAWIGLRRTRLWSDQSGSSFRYWKAEDPIVSLEHLSPSCTAVSSGDSGRWTEERCNIPLPFVCQTGSAGSLRQYHFVREPKSWAEAQSFCRYAYADLATVDDMSDIRRLLESINATYVGSAWIGLYDDPKNSWRWSLDDPQFYKEGEREFRRWHGHPLNECGIVCALMLFNTHPIYEGKWIERPCTEEHHFVCYNESNETTEAYVPVADPKNWAEAWRYCREHYVDLASVRNQEQNLEIFKRTSESTPIKFLDGVWGVWIGLHRIRTWSDDSNSSFAYWKDGEPDNGESSVSEYLNQYCTAASFSRSGQWTDEDCMRALPFVCYSLNSTAEPSSSDFDPAVNSTPEPSPPKSSDLNPAVNSTAESSPTPSTEPNPTVNSTAEPSPTPSTEPTPAGMSNCTVNSTAELSPTPSTEPNPAVISTVEPLTDQYNKPKPAGMFQRHVFGKIFQYSVYVCVCLFCTVNSTAEPSPTPSTEPNPAVISTVQPPTVPYNEPKATVNSTAEPSPTPSTEPNPAVNSTVEPSTAPYNEPKPTVNSTVEPSTVPNNQPKPTVNSTTEPSPTPSTEPNPAVNSTIKPSTVPYNEPKATVNSTVGPSTAPYNEPKPTVNSTVEPSTVPYNQPKPTVNSTTEPSPTPSTEPNPAVNSTVEPSTVPNNQPKPTVNSTTEPSPTPSTEPNPAVNSTTEPSPTPSTEPNPAVNSTIKPSTVPYNEPKATVNSTVEPSTAPYNEPKPTVNSTVEPSTVPYNQPKPTVNSTTEPSPTPSTEPNPAVNSTVEPSTVPNNQPKPTVNSTTEPSPTPSTEPNPAVNSTTEPSPTPSTEPNRAVNSTIKPSTVPYNEPKATVNSTVGPSTAPYNEPKPTVNSTVEPSTVPYNQPKPTVNSTTEPSPTPSTEPNPAVNSTAEPLPTPSTEPNPAVISTVEPSIIPYSEPKATVNSTAEPSPTPSTEPNPAVNSTVEPSTAPYNEPKPTVNSTVEPSTVPYNQPKPTVNSTTEPSPTPSTEPNPAVNSTIKPSTVPYNEPKATDSSTVGPSTTPSNESKPADNSTVGPSTTPDYKFNPAGNVHTDSGLICLRAKVSTQVDLPESEVEKLVLMKLEEEILRLGFPHNFRLRVRSSHKITP